MLGWATTFLAIGLTAGAFSIAPSSSSQVARVIFLVFIGLFAVALILRGLIGPPRSAGPPPPPPSQR